MVQHPLDNRPIKNGVYVGNTTGDHAVLNMNARAVEVRTPCPAALKKGKCRAEDFANKWNDAGEGGPGCCAPVEGGILGRFSHPMFLGRPCRLWCIICVRHCSIRGAVSENIG